jgi:hypothetical protein
MIFIILGITLILWGGLTIIHPKSYSSRFNMYFDFTGIEWPLGGLLIAFGIAFIWSEMRKKRTKS